MYMKYKDLLIELVKREIKARYKQSVLGYAWVILVPLVNLVVLSLVFSYFVRIPTGDVPYAAFLFTGLIPWTFTANSIMFSTSGLIANRSLITKIYIPTEIFPLATIITKLIDFVLTIIIGFGLALVFKIQIDSLIWYLPLIFSVQFLLTAGIALITSALNVFYRDIENVMGVVVTIWMYISPVLYPQNLVPVDFVSYYNLNPMVSIMGAYRNIILYNMPPPWQSFIYSAIFSVAIFIFGLVFFKAKSKYFADVI